MIYKNVFLNIAIIASLLITLTGACGARGQSRVEGSLDESQRVAVRGTTSHLLHASLDAGRMAGSEKLGRMVLVLAPTAEQEQQEEALLTALHDSSSPLFHKWLSPAEYGDRFGISHDDAAKVQQWLEGYSLSVQEISQSRRFVIFSGTVSQVEHAFSTEMHHYTYKEKSFVSNASDIQIPAALRSVVKGVVRLHSNPKMSEVVMGGKVHFNKSTGKFEAGGGHYLTPADFAKIYNLQPLYDAGIDGTGQTIAIVGRSNIDVQNVRDFRNQLGLVPNDPVVIVNGDDPNQPAGDMPEAMLDVTWSGAVAPKATVIFVVSQSNFADGIDASAAYIVDHNLAPVISTSYGACEQNLGPVQNAFYSALWKQAAAQGITSFVSSGDSGGAGCDPSGGLYGSGVAVNGIASTPYNIAVGGTQFDDTANPGAYWNASADPVTGLSALGYIPEKVWNESSNDPNGVLLLGGGGGISTIYAKPNWQSAAGVPNDGKRDVPDISLTAAVHDGYLLCLFGSCSGGQYFYSFGGTSASSPAAAGIMALVNQKMNGQPQGMANYVFYRLASIPGVYHDVTQGDNKVPDSNGQFTLGYSAGTGYDLASGLGSFDANALINNWEIASTGTASTTTLALGVGQKLPVVHGAPINFRSTVTCNAGIACASATGNVTLLATDGSGNAVGSGASQLKVGSPSSVNISAATVPGGTYNVAARYGGDANYFASVSSPVPVTVMPEPSQTIVGSTGSGVFTTSPVTLTYGEPLPFAIVVRGNSGVGYPSGQLTLLADGQPTSPLGAFGLNPSTLTLNYGEKSTLLAASNAPTSQSSTTAFLPSCIQNLPTCPQSSMLNAGAHKLQASYPGDNSFGSSQGTYAFNVAKADSFIADFFPLGNMVAGVPVTLMGQIALTNNWCGPYGGTVTVTEVTTSTPVVLGSAPASQQYCDSYSVSVTFNTPGTHVVKVTFTGDTNVNGSSSGNFHMPVASNAPSSTSLTTDAAGPLLVGSPVHLTATVITPVSQHQPTGQSVTFLDGGKVIGTAPLGNPVNLGSGAYGLTAQLLVLNFSGGQHNLIAQYAGDSVLTASDSSGTPTLVSIMDYSVQAAPPTLTIKDGFSGTASISLFPLGGFAQPVQLSCGTLPRNVSCTLSKSPVTLDGTNPAVVQVVVGTGGTLAAAAPSHGAWAAASAFALAGLLLPFGRRKKTRTVFLALALFVVAVAGFGCGSSSSSSNPNLAQVGTYSVNITAASPGTNAKPVTFVVNVTP